MQDELNKKYIDAKKKAAENMAGARHGSNGGKNRVPPGQRVVPKMVAMPPITIRYPKIDRKEWKLRVYGEIDKEMVWNYEELMKLGVEEFTVDFHCVTTWSKLDQVFTGIDFKKIMNAVRPTKDVKHVIFESADGYTTNVVYQELLDNPSFVAMKMNDDFITTEYGGPVRFVIPHLYGWKSAKFLTGIRFVSHDEPGFWEVRGYHNHADPWKEERFS